MLNKCCNMFAKYFNSITKTGIEATGWHSRSFGLQTTQTGSSRSASDIRIWTTGGRLDLYNWINTEWKFWRKVRVRLFRWFCFGDGRKLQGDSYNYCEGVWPILLWWRLRMSSCLMLLNNIYGIKQAADVLIVLIFRWFLSARLNHT